MLSTQNTNWIQPLLPKDMNGLIKLCQLLVEARCVPVWHHEMPNPAGSVFACVMKGAELGWPIMASVQSLQNVNGLLTVWGDALLGMVKIKSDYEYLTEEWDEETHTAICRAKRKGEPEVIRKFSREDAERANLYKSQKGNDKVTYKYYEYRMLQSKARNFAIRDTWPHHLCGFKIVEETLEYNELPTELHEKLLETRPALSLEESGAVGGMSIIKDEIIYTDLLHTTETICSPGKTYIGTKKVPNTESTIDSTLNEKEIENGTNV